jgi:Mrp family chromosome partitioning ATPase
MEKLLVDLRGKFDLVILDSAPLSPVHDTWSLERLADATLLVVRSGSTPREAVASAVRTLRAMRANVAGVALTRAEGGQPYGDYLAKPTMH